MSSPVIYQAKATDDDRMLCIDGSDCHCAQIVYELSDASSLNEGLFAVDSTTGEVALTGNRRIINPYK